MTTAIVLDATSGVRASLVKMSSALSMITALAFRVKAAATKRWCANLATELANGRSLASHAKAAVSSLAHAEHVWGAARLSTKRISASFVMARARSVIIRAVAAKDSVMLSRQSQSSAERAVVAGILTQLATSVAVRVHSQSHATSAAARVHLPLRVGNAKVQAGTSFRFFYERNTILQSHFD